MSILFEIPLPPFTLEGGPRLPGLHLRGWAAGPGIEPLNHWMITAPDGNRPVQRSQQELDALWERDFEVDLNAEVPTVLVVHALTADAAAGEEGGWWEPVIGPGRAIDTKSTRVLCFNNLGSCYGSYGPDDPGFPRWSEYPRWTRLARRSDYQPDNKSDTRSRCLNITQSTEFLRLDRRNDLFRTAGLTA